MSTSVFNQPVVGLRFLSALGIGSIALFLGLFYSAQAGLLILAAAWLAILTWKYPWKSFLSLIIIAPFLLIIKATVVLGAITVLKDIVILTLFIRVLSEGGTRLPKVILIPVLTYVAWAVVAFLSADSRLLGLLRLRDLLLYVPMIIVGVRLVSSPARLRLFLKVFLSTALIVLFLGLIQWVFFADGMVLRHDPVKEIWIPRVASVLAHPNVLGSYLLFVIPIAAALFITPKINKKYRYASLGILLASLLAVFATYSRSAWMAVAVSLAAMAFLFLLLRIPYQRALAKGKSIGVFVLVSILFLVVAFVFPPTRTFLTSVTNPAYESNRERIDIVVGALIGISRKGVIIGEGLGSPALLLDRTANISLYEIASAEAGKAQVAKARTFVDNAVVKTIMEQGVVGLVLAGWVAFRLSLAAFRAIGNQDYSSDARAFGLGFLGLIFGLSVLWLFLDVPDIFPVNLYFWTFAGITASITSMWAYARPTELESET